LARWERSLAMWAASEWAHAHHGQLLWAGCPRRRAYRPKSPLAIYGTWPRTSRDADAGCGAIGAAAKRLVEFRDGWLNPPGSSSTLTV